MQTVLYIVGKLSDNNLAKFQPKLVQARGCRLGVQNACTTQIFISKRRKNRISTPMRLVTLRHQANKVLIDKRKYQFSWTTVVWQVTRNRQIFVAVEKLSRWEKAASKDWSNNSFLEVSKIMPNHLTDFSNTCTCSSDYTQQWKHNDDFIFNYTCTVYLSVGL